MSRDQRVRRVRRGLGLFALLVITGLGVNFLVDTDH